MGTRKLAYSETMHTGLLGGTNKGRARANAKRQIEELGQNDRMIAVLNRISEQLQWITEEMARNRRP